MNAPIALFVYNRPTHTQQTVEALRANVLAADSDLFVFSDAPKSAAANHSVAKVRAFVSAIDGFKSVTLIEREANWGVDASVIDGVTHLCNQFGRAIVLEDDIVTAPGFLRYMNHALELYKHDESVMQVSGFMFPVDGLDERGASFLPLMTSWGWATWDRAWAHFDHDAAGYAELRDDEGARHAFNIDGAYDYFDLLANYIDRKTDAWDIRFYLGVFRKHGLALFPNRSLVDNIGFDGSGVHSSIEDRIVNELTPMQVSVFPEPRVNTVALKKVQNYLRARNNRHIYSKKRRFLRAAKRRLAPFVSRADWVRIDQFKQKLKLLSFKKNVGRNTYIDKTVQVLGWKHLAVGHSSTISEGSWINVNQRVDGHNHVIIGNNCFIGKRNFFSSGWQIEISDYCLTGSECKFLGGDHIFDDPLIPYISTGVTNDKIIRLGTNVWVGAGVTVIGNVNIGHGSIIGADTLINKSIPPFSMVFGNPSRIHKRYDFVLNQWILLSDYQGAHEYAMPDEVNYREILKGAFPVIHMPLQASGRRFGDML